MTCDPQNPTADAPPTIVFLVDVDNTLLDNDRIQDDLQQYLEREYGPDVRARYWELQEQVFQEVGYRDYLEALQRYRREHPTDIRLLSMASWLTRYPCANRLYPHAIDVLRRLGTWGPTVILSDGDVIFQPRKIFKAGIEEAVDGHVLIYIHKEEALEDVARRHPADHYVMIDDKLRILDALKKAWGDRVTTVFPRQGKFALDPAIVARYPDAADVTIERIGDLLHLELADILGRRRLLDARAKDGAAGNGARRVLVIDIGGTSVKFTVTGLAEPRRFPSGRTMTPGMMIARIKEMTEDLVYDAVSMGYPGPVFDNRPLAEPHNLAPGWVGFDFAAAFGCDTRVVNDAALQAIGSYGGGRMLFLGLGTGLGSALIVDGTLMPMEVARLPYRDATYEDYTGIRGLERLGEEKWRESVFDVVARLTEVLGAEDVVLGGGNVHRLPDLPPRCRAGDNSHAFEGGFRMWQEGMPPKG